MDMTCRCKGLYTCVACKVRRGDYMDWKGEPRRRREVRLTFDPRIRIEERAAALERLAARGALGKSA